MKKIAILGSTGSIGTSALQIARHLKNDIQVMALAAKSNIDLLEQQANEFHPEIIAVFDKDKAQLLQKRLPKIEVVGGMEGLEAVSSYAKADFVISALAGTIGLIPTLTAIKARKNVGLANKEALVSGGALVMSLAKANNVSIIPIDSEHSAIFQCLNGEETKSIQRLILTSSGGPFREHSKEQLKNISVDQALNHPTWTMGPKVTIDSSTLMNKGLEVIEAHWLFNIPVDKIDVVIHPQSIIHSFVEFIDGSMLSQMSEPTMIIPIQYALTYPKRYPGMIRPFDFSKNSTLQFFKPDTEKFICLRLAYDAVKEGGTLPCYMNAANEVLVNRFLSKQLNWNEIGQKLELLMNRHNSKAVNSVDDILHIDILARQEAKEI